MAFEQSAPGAPVAIRNDHLVLGRNTFNVLSLVPAPHGVGTGAFFGLTSPLLATLAAPPGSVFHFFAAGTTAAWGPFPAPPGLTVDAVAADVILPSGRVRISAAARITVR